MAAVMATGVPNPAVPSRKDAEGKGDEQGLEAAVIGDAGQGVLDDLEFAAFHRHVVDPDGGDHDPDDGKDAEGQPFTVAESASPPACPRR